MRGIITIIATIVLIGNLNAQPPLNKRDQKRKAEFEAQIEAEEKYAETVDRAGSAFKNKDYVGARMAYYDAIQYDADKEQWLTSKVYDLDILLARRAAREVDSISAMRNTTEVVLPTDQSKGGIEVRDISGQASEVVEAPEIDSAEALAEMIMPPREEAPEKNEEPKPTVVREQPVAPNQTVNKRDIQLTPKSKVSVAEPEPAKAVEEDYSSFDNGVTEETFTLANSEVLRVVVKEGIDVIVFKRVKHRWGGEFFFMDNQDVTRRYWEDQVRMFREKYPQ